MTWVQAFPTNNTKINQSVNQIQQNWLFIQNNVNTDHYFNSGGASEGHHKFVHLPTQGADPALILTGVVYQKTVFAGNPGLYYRNAAWGASQITSGWTGRVGAIVGNNVLFSLAGRPPCSGIVTCWENALPTNLAIAFIFWTGAGAVSWLIAANNQITNIFASGTDIVITKSVGPSTLEWNFTKMESI